MRNSLKILGLGLCLLYLFYSCQKDESIHIASSVVLDKLTASGKIGDSIHAKVSFTNGSISRLVITKSVDGTTSPDYRTEVPVSGTSFQYDFIQMILSGGENGSLVYTFSGYDTANTLIDASDLTVSVTLSGYPLLIKYDWRLIEEIVDGTNSNDPKLWDNVYRLNANYSWQYDWGATGPINLEDLNQYCAWKIIGNESKIDSIHFVKFGFLSTVPVYDKWKVSKLEGESLWLSTTIDLSWLGLSSEAPVIQKYVAVPKSDSFDPYGSADENGYNWAPCTPGEH